MSSLDLVTLFAMGLGEGGPVLKEEGNSMGHYLAGKDHGALGGGVVRWENRQREREREREEERERKIGREEHEQAQCGSLMKMHTFSNPFGKNLS